MTDPVRDIVEAFQREMAAPVRGEVISRIMEKIGFATFASMFLGMASEKLELTRSDGKIHDFMLLLPSESMMVGVRCFVHQGTLRDGALAAKDDLYGTFGQLAPSAAVAGVLHMAVFAERHPIELTLAWLPFPDWKGDDADLGSPVIPWRSDYAAIEKEPPSLNGACIVALAQATHELTGAMRLMISIWPEEDGPVVRLGLPKGREALQTAIDAFNTAAKRCRLAHQMPVSIFDATWLPHNQRNALNFQSVPATLSAELDRTWGPDAGRGFRDALDIVSRGERNNPRLDEVAAMGGPAVRGETKTAVPPPLLDVFICYTWADKTRGARDVYEFVVRQGVTAWLDEEQRPVDAALDSQIAQALQTTRAVVGCFSREMITRGGYAVRELLFALAFAPERLILARLDKTPVPLSLRGVRAVDWFTRDGPDHLREQLLSIGGRPATLVTLTLAIPEGPLTESLLRLVQRPLMQPRCFVGEARRAQLTIRAALLEKVLEVFDHYESHDWHAISERVDELRQADQWPLLTSALIHQEPTLIGPAIRLRFALFVAEVQMLNQGDWCEHNRAASGILEELLAVDPSLFIPAPETGWLVKDCRVAVRDCLDAFANATEWFRGWSPTMLAEMCKVPLETVITVEERMRSREADLGDRMLALRIVDDTTSSDVASWTSMWTSLRAAILDKFNADGHPLTPPVYGKLRSLISNGVIARVAVAMADGVVEAFRVGGSWREELIENCQAICVRFVVRSYRGVNSKTDSLALARGTVQDDLMNHPHTTDLTVLVSTFVLPSTSPGDSQFEVNLNVMPHPRPDAVEQLADLGPVIMPQMLSDDEQVQLQGELKGPFLYGEA